MNLRLLLATLPFVATFGIAPACFAEDPASRSPEIPTAMSFLAALGRLDFDAAGRLLDDDASLELPYAGSGLTVKGRKPILQFFRTSMARSTGAIEYTLDRAYPSAEAGALVLEISTRARTAAGLGYTNRLVAIFELHRKKIVLFREYFNPAVLIKPPVSHQ